MQFHKDPNTGYLTAVLWNGTRNYRYRRGIRSLVGLVHTEFRRAVPSPLSPPMGFRYLDARLSAGHVARKKAPLLTTRTHGDAGRGIIAGKLEGTRNGIQTELSEQTMSDDGGPSRPQSANASLSGGKISAALKDFLNKNNKEAIAPEKDSKGKTLPADASHTLNTIAVPGDSRSYQQDSVMNKSAQQGEMPSAGTRHAWMERPAGTTSGSLPSSHTPLSDQRCGQPDKKDDTIAPLCISPQPHAAPLQREREKKTPCVRMGHASLNSVLTSGPVATTRERSRSPSTGYHQSAELIVKDEAANSASFDADKSNRTDHPTLLRSAMIMKRSTGTTAERHDRFSTEKNLLNPLPALADGKVQLHRSGGGSASSGVNYGCMDDESKKESSRCDEKASFRSAGEISLKKPGGAPAAEQHPGISKARDAAGMPEEAAEAEMVLGYEEQRAARTESKESAATRIAHLLASRGKRFKTALRQGEAAASTEAYACFDSRSVQRQAEQIDEMRRVGRQMIVKISQAGAYDQSEIMERREPALPLPEKIERLYIVRRQAGRRSMPAAFWERSYQGRYRLKTLR